MIFKHNDGKIYDIEYLSDLHSYSLSEDVDHFYRKDDAVYAITNGSHSLIGFVIEQKEGEFLFRQHRGSLSDSMKTVVSVKSLNGIKEVLQKNCDFFEVAYLFCNEYGYDDRIEWNTYIITGNVLSADKRNTHQVVFGFTNGLVY